MSKEKENGDGLIAGFLFVLVVYSVGVIIGGYSHPTKECFIRTTLGTDVYNTEYVVATDVPCE